MMKSPKPFGCFRRSNARRKAALSRVAGAFICLAAVSAAPPPDDSLWCAFTQKDDCQPGRACISADPEAVTARIDQRRHLYFRCEGAKCDSYGYVESGDYKNYRTLEMPGRGAFAKIGPDNQITEVVSLGHMALVSQGMCFTDRELNKKP